MASESAVRERSPGAKGVLLSTCGRFSLTPSEIEHLGLAAAQASEAEWAEVIDEALRRGGGGLLFHHLRAAGMDPPAELREEHRRIAVSDAAWEAELRGLGDALREAGVSVLLIKGAALRGNIYKDAGLRPMDDVDWVLKEEGETALLVLEELGYRQWDEAYSNLWAREDFLIDLHQNVWGDERVNARTSGLKAEGGEEHADAGVWRRARPSPLGEPYLVPSPEDHLLILCAHLMKHNFEPGIWFTDIEALLGAEPGFDWEAALARARAWGLLRPLAYAFRILGALEEGEEPRDAPPPLPARVRRALGAVRPTPLDRALLSVAAAGGRLKGEKQEWGRAPVGNLLWLSSQEGLGAKVRLLWEAVFPRGEVMGQIYPGYRPSLRWWYMLRRAGDLVRLGIRLAPRLWARGGGEARAR